MSGVKKRALSPVVATVLLISIALVLAIIIFLWAKNFLPEVIEKDGQSVELVCENVRFEVEASGSQLVVQNIGNVPIYGIEVRVQGTGEIKEVSEAPGGGTIGNGQTQNFPLPAEVGVGDIIIAVPILLGETTDDRVPHICDVDYGREAVVGT